MSACGEVSLACFARTRKALRSVAFLSFSWFEAVLSYYFKSLLYFVSDMFTSVVALCKLLLEVLCSSGKGCIVGVNAIQTKGQAI